MRANLLLVLWEMGCWTTAVAGKRSHKAESCMALWMSKRLTPVLKLMAAEASCDRKKAFRGTQALCESKRESAEGQKAPSTS